MLSLQLAKPIIVGAETVSQLTIDEDKVTAKTLRQSKSESNNAKHTADEAVDHLVCKIVGLMSHELDSLTARDYLKLRNMVSDFLDPTEQ